MTRMALMIWTLGLVAIVVLVQGGLGAGRESQQEKEGETGGKSPAYGWELVVAKAAFSPRDTAEPLVYDGKMWLSNGWYHGGKLSRDLWCSSDGRQWTLVNGDTPYDPCSELVAYRGKMWAIKGSVWCSEDGVKWDRVAEKTPFGVRGYGEAVVFRDRIWQLGSGADVWYTSDGVKWTCATEQAPYGRRAASAVVTFEAKLWLLAGRTPGANTPPEKGYKDITTHNDVWCSADGANWELLVEHAPWGPRQWTVAVVYRGRMWLIAGYDNVNHRNFGDVWCSADGKRWRKFVAEPMFSPRHEVSPFVFAGSLWVVAGNSWPVQNDVWRLRLPADWAG